MSQLRTYQVHTGPLVTEACDGCGAEIPPGAEVTMRQDAALFCTLACCALADDMPLEELRARRPTPETPASFFALECGAAAAGVAEIPRPAEVA